MCILRNGSMCHFLSTEERLAQHNFEERKGPYPFALAQRLEAEGVISVREHFIRSIIQRNKNVLGSVGYDGAPEELDYIYGERHTAPPTDPTLTHRNQERLRKALEAKRFERFWHNLRIGAHVSNIFDYPEAPEWVAARIVLEGRESDPMYVHMREHAHGLTMVARYLPKEQVVRVVVRIIRSCFINGYLPGHLETRAAILSSVQGKKRRQAFEQHDKRARADESNPNQRQRLRAEIAQWRYLSQLPLETAGPLAEQVYARMMEASQPEALSLAA